MIRKTFSVVALFLLSLTLAPATFAASRGHAARPTLVSLSGRIVESGTGTSGFSVEVTVQGQTVKSNKDGSYELTRLNPGVATVTFERFGYVTVTRSVDLHAGFNGLNVTVQTKPVITLTDKNGDVHPMDYDTSDFASLFPFTSPETLPSIEFCRNDASKFEIAKSEFKTVTGPGVILVGPACCPGTKGTEIRFETKAGASGSGIISDCKYYQVIFLGLNRETGMGESFDLPDIAKMVFP